MQPAKEKNAFQNSLFSMDLKVLPEIDADGSFYISFFINQDHP